MKGRILTLDEIKNLKDGTKIWIDYPKTDTLFTRINKLCIKKNSPFMRLDIIGSNMCLGLNVDDIKYKAYEWIED